MRRLLVGRRHHDSEAGTAASGNRLVAEMSSASERLRTFVTRFSSAHRRPWKRIPVPSLRRPAVTAWSAGRAAEPDVDLGREWIQVGEYLERMAPEGVSAEELGRVEDAAAERIYERLRRGARPASSAGYVPGSRKRSMPLRRGV
jgi:hypothetical protein